ncbi:unnamed protein product [Bemisia tabaci]|uniref:UDP-glucuronosyltransferase n=1 Tax=Bemisia tabaci TaxID=7038 RepID=A0A9P0APB5_BEMTA|nr:unnamed protein product [Bemisia tabaci]
MKSKLLVFLLFVWLANVQRCFGYKILGLFPYNGRSHIVIFESIMKGLAERGHEVHVLSHYPQKVKIANYTDLSVLGSIPLPNNQFSFDGFSSIRSRFHFFNNMFALYSMIEGHEGVMKSEAVQKLMKSNERYDLIITESWIPDMMLGFVHKFKVPLVLLSSFGPPPWTSDFLANPQNPAYVQHHLAPYSPRMSFMERVSNTGGLFLNLVAWYGLFLPKNERIMRKYFGEDTPPLLETLRNASLVLANTHPTIHGARPYAANVFGVGGVHLAPVKKLPKDIEEFIEKSQHGVIYFCMGSLLRAATFPEEKKKAFLHTFSKLKERVLWKFEEKTLTAPKNVMIKEWMPQRDILAHPKVKLFIGHGGLLGTLEAMSEGKPMVGIPMFGDQSLNLRTLEDQGVAKLIKYDEITNETINDAVQEMLKPEYAERAKELARLFHDRPMSAMDTAVYWIEYVIRSKGARKLRSAAVDLTFYQYLLLDVILFYVISVICIVYLIFYLLGCLFCRSKSKHLKSKVKRQ